jgi:hypothetical protein
MSEWKNTPSNIRQGVSQGLFFALAYSAFVTVVYLLGGRAAFERVGLTYIETVGLYFGAGVFAGLLGGALKPLGRWLIGGIIVGFVVAWPIVFFVMLGVFPPGEEHLMVPSSIAGAAILGPGYAIISWFQERGHR